MKKNNSLKKFNKLAKRIYKISKKRELGWKWQDAQKWTSANIFQKYKDTPISKIKVTEVDSVIFGILDGSEMPIPKVGGRKPTEVCFNINQITNDQTEDVPFYYLYDRIYGGNGEIGFDDNLKIAVEIDGFVSTGVIKKYELNSSTITDLVKGIRLLNLSSSDYDIIFKRVVISDKESQKDNPCNVYILITMLGSSADVNTDEVNMDVKKKDLMPELQSKIDEAKRVEAEAKRQKELKQKALKQERPKQVEPKPIQPTKVATAKDSKANRLVEYNKAVKDLKAFLDDGLITKKQFSKRFEELGKNLKDGGII
jgi:hypothetical protein